MIYLLTYFILEHFDAPSSYFSFFWGIIFAEMLFAIIGGIIQGINEK